MKKILNLILVFTISLMIVGCSEKNNEYFIFKVEIYNSREQLVYSEEFETNERKLLQALINFEEWIIETEYGSVGRYIISINGLSAEDGQFWNYYVNDEPTTIGIENYQLKEYDTIKIILESTNNNGA